MLLFKGTLQAPLKYPVSELRARGPVTFKPPPERESLCALCVSSVWTPSLFAALRASGAKTQRYVTSYPVTSLDLKAAAFQNCPWCCSLADGIHGYNYLDGLYERLAQSESSSESGDDNSSETESTQEDWERASDFNDEDDESNDEDDDLGVWAPVYNKEILDPECNFRISLSFERGEGDLFTFLNAHIESTDKDVDNDLRKLRGRSAVALRYRVNIDNVVPEESMVFPIATENKMLGSDLNLQRIVNWIHASEKATPLPSSQPSSVPSRLLDVAEETCVRVVKTSHLPLGEDGQSQKFAALSYVWGTNQPLVLLAGNEESLMAAIDPQALPPTIRDAVLVARRVGLRYLWVDALCIMQDSNADKAIELPKMRQIYRCAYLTIVAAVARSTREGFLHILEHNDFFIPPIPVPYYSEPPSEASAQVILSYPVNYKRWRDPINDRAWTFQELILSLRAVVFSYRGIDFIDRRNIPHADGLESGKDPQMPGPPWAGRMFSLTPGVENLRQVWLTIRGEYSRRQLTYSGDKLLAIAAIAEEIGSLYGSAYLAGLWEKDLALELLWRRSNPNFGEETYSAMPNAEQMRRKPRPDGYIAPTWSWASISGEVDDGGVGEDGIVDSLGFEVARCEVELANPNFHYGAVRSGALFAKARVHSCIWRPHQAAAHDTNDGSLVVKVNNEQSPDIVVGEALIDAFEPQLVDGCILDCMAICVLERPDGKTEVEGLLLREVGELDHQRVGVFTIYSPAMFEDTKLMDIKII